MENRQQKSTSPKGTDGTRFTKHDFNSHINDNTTTISASITSLWYNYNIIIPQIT